MRPGRAGAAVVALCLLQFVDVLGVTVVISALPSMLADVGSGSPLDGTLISTGYAMLFGGLLVFGARLGDRIGHRRTILVSLVLFALGALLAAVAGSAVVLTIGRCVQGAAAAAAVPSALTILTSIVDGERARARALAAWSAAGAAASGSGFVIGGVVADLGNWRWIFWGMLAVALAQGVSVLLLVDPTAVGDGPAERPALNPVGSALLTAAVMLLVVGATLLAEPPHRVLATVLLAGSVACAWLFVRADRRSRSPLLPPALLRLPQVRRGAAGAFLNTAAMSSVATLITLYLQDTLGRTPLAAAVTLLPFSIMVIVGSAAAARLVVGRPRERVTTLGLTAIAVGVAGPLVQPDSAPLVGAGMAVAGLGLGLSSVATTSLGTDVDLRRRATASGIVNTSPQLGTAVGTAFLLLLATATTGLPGTGTPTPTPAWAAAAVLAAVGAAVFLALRPVPAVVHPAEPAPAPSTEERST